MFDVRPMHAWVHVHVMHLATSRAHVLSKLFMCQGNRVRLLLRKKDKEVEARTYGRSLSLIDSRLSVCKEYILCVQSIYSIRFKL